MRGTLGIYSDDVFWLEEIPGGLRISAEEAFLVFACAVGERFDGYVLIGRTLRGRGPAPQVLPSTAKLAELPYYESLRRPGQVLRASLRTIAGMWGGLGRVDTVWAMGPNPFGIVLIGLALLRGKRVALGVRQDTVRYYRSRLPSMRWKPVMAVAWAMDRVYRLLARVLPTTVVGTHLAGSYADGRASVLPMIVSLVRAGDVARVPPERSWKGPIELLAVGRIEPEKNPLLLVDALARLEREQPGRYVLGLVGHGALEEAVRLHARRLGVADRVQLHGYVPFGPRLLELYRAAHILVHASLTEGVPQVLFEALACGTPVIATDVGGVHAALEGGSCGLLVPRSDADALVRAIRQMTSDRALREQLVARGLELARRTTLENEAARVARFLVGDRPSA